MPEAVEQPKEKCSYCEEQAAMKVKNLDNNVEKNFCRKHFGAFITDGQSRVYEQFIAAMQRGT